LGAQRFEFSPEIRFGAACGGGEGLEADGDGTGGQGFVGIPVRRGGDDDGTVELDGERLARVTFFAMEEGGSGGQAAEAVGEARANGSGVIEGENPVVLGGSEKFSCRAGEGEEGSGRGIEQGAQHAGGGGFAAGGRAVENQNGMRADGAKGGEEPDGQARAVGYGCEVEGRREERVLRGCDGVRELEVAAAVEEGDGWVGGDLPAVGRDFDNFTVGVGEIEQDGVGMMGMAARGDAPVDGKAR
jgi:hypothetical protein